MMDDEYPHLTIARVERDQLTGEVKLLPLESDRMVDVQEGAEYVTIRSKVNLFLPPP